MTPEELEEAAARDAVAGLRERLAAFTLKAQTSWDMLEEPSRLFMRGMIADSLAALDTSDVAEPIRKATMTALGMGARDAARRAGVVPPNYVMPSTSLMRVSVEAPEKAAEELRKAADRVREAVSSDDLQDALNRATRAVSRTEAAARFAVNRSLSEGVQRVADQAGLSRVWLPERDACVHCLAYAGEVAGPGESFRGGLTFGVKPLVPASEDVHCPLHPNCRCRVQVYDVDKDSPDLPDSLKREALRSILRGWSLESESQKVRLDAADRALKSASRMPKSVQDYARKAVKRGAFPRGTEFPKPGRKTLPLPRKTRSEQQELKPDNNVGPKVDPNPLRDLPRKEGAPATQTRPSLDGSFSEMVYGWDTKDAERNADVRFTNPNYGMGMEWGVNCQRVAVAYELRRRGYLVEAAPNPKTAGTTQYTDEMLADVWAAPEYLKPNGEATSDPEAPGAIKNTTGKRRWTAGLTALALRAQVSTWPPNSRGWIIATWKGGGRHIWNVEVGADGKPNYIDAQLRVALKDGQPHFRDAVGGSLKLLRVDDLEPTDEQPKMVLPVVPEVQD